ncbi:MAG: Gfo/Idh/MocA family protein [Candidatus Dormibacterales bacterium]
MTVGWGLVGIGGHADKALAPAITAVEEARLVGVVSRDRQRAEDFAGRHGAARAWTSYEEMLRDPEVDVVSVTTPNALHTEHVVAAARAGKHVLCDKPLALTHEDAERDVEECRRAGVRLGIDFQMRHAAWASKVRDLIGAGALGQPVAVQAEQASGRVGFGGWRMDPDLAGLGSVYNIGVHLYDLLRFLLASEVREVSAMLDTGRKPELEKLAMTLLRFENGTLAYVNANQAVVNPQHDVEVYGDKGRIRAVSLSRHQQEGELRVISDGQEDITRETTEDVFRRVVAYFCEAVTAGREPLASGLDGLRSVEITEAIARSAREGRVVSVERAEVG